jgi:hypothetical protein
MRGRNAAGFRIRPVHRVGICGTVPFTPRQDSPRFVTEQGLSTGCEPVSRRISLATQQLAEIRRQPLLDAVGNEIGLGDSRRFAPGMFLFRAAR